MANEKDKKDKKNEQPSVKTAKNFNELYDIIKKMGKIIGSSGIEYEIDDLISRINELRKGLKKFQGKDEIKKLKELTQETVKELIGTNGNLKVLMCQITRAEGLRIRAVKLSIDEVITREISRGIGDETKNI